MKAEVEFKAPEIRTASDLVRHIENTLGWLPPDDKPPWKSRQIEAGKINRQIKTRPNVTIENLVLTVELLRRRKTEVRSPVGVCYFVDEALELAAEEADSTLVERLEEARATEDRPEWVRRLQRVVGAGAIREALTEWEASQ